MKVVVFAVLAVCLMPLLGTRCAAEGAARYLAKDGKLLERLEVRDLQGGFVGLTGKAWKIEPGGRWTLTKVTNDRTDEVVREGTLTKEQLRGLAEELAKFDLAGLPEKEGEDRANPHVVKVKFGKREAVLTLSPAAPLREVEAPAKSTPDRRFGSILKAVRKAVGDAK